LAAEKKLFLDHVLITGARLRKAASMISMALHSHCRRCPEGRGRRVVLDTIESLFSELPNPGILRAEIRRLFGWLKEKELTRHYRRAGPARRLTRHGIEEFVSDCVIVLDHRVRRISRPGACASSSTGFHPRTNEYPFLIDEQGISVLPISSLGLTTLRPPNESPAHYRLDGMLGGEGF